MQMAKTNRWILLPLGMLLCALARPTVQGANVAVAWDAPVPATNVASYVLEVGTSSRVYQTITNVGLRTNITLTGLQPGQRYFLAAASISKQGRKSSYSNELIVDVPEPDQLPTISGLRNVVMEKNTESDVLPFQLADGSGAGSNWAVWATSSNQQLLSDGDIILGGSSTNRTLQLLPIPEVIGTAIITVSVTDGVQTNTGTFQLTVTPNNLAPVVDAGASATVRTNLSFMLRGRATDDGLPLTPGRLTVQWSKFSGPGVVTFGNSNYAVTTVRFSAPGLYRLRLTATDGALTTYSETIIRAQLISDLTRPVITNLTVAEVTQNSITLTWTTDEMTDDQVKYTTAEFTLPKFTLLNQTPKLLHSVTVTNLSPDTTYTLLARSRDASANETFSDPVVVQTLQEALIVSPVSASPSDLSTPSGYAYDRDDLATDGQETASFPFYAPIADTYYVWVRMQAPTDIYQPFSTGVDLGARDAFDPPAGSWSAAAEWVVLNGRGESAPLTLTPRAFTLRSGNHTVYFSGKGAKASVKRILVTNNPEFVPADGDPCCPAEGESSSPEVTIAVRQGFSMIACPVTAPFPYLSSMLPNPPVGTVFFKYDQELGTYVQNLFDGVSWESPEMPLNAGEGGLLYNPGEPFTWTLSGSITSSPEMGLEQLYVGFNFLAPIAPKAGFLSTVLGGLQFKAGDTVQRMVDGNGTYQTYSFDGQKWDIIPVINVGEAIILNLVPR